VDANLQKRTSEQLDSSLELVVRKWLAVYGEMFQREVTRELVTIWLAEFSGTSAKQFGILAEKARSKARFFPQPADLREVEVAVREAQKSLTLEEAWESALNWIERWYVGPDVGIDHRAPVLEEKMRRAIGAAGGMEYLASCPTAELHWAKDRFTENYANQQIVEREGYLLSDREAREFLAECRNQANALPLPKP